MKSITFPISVSSSLAMIVVFSKFTNPSGSIQNTSFNTIIEIRFKVD
jgi:hypothetical protein